MLLNFNHMIDYNNNNGFGKEMKDPIEITPANLKKTFRRLDYLMHLILENDNVGLNSESQCLHSWTP